MRLKSILVFPGNDSSRLVTSSGSRAIPIRVARDFDRFAEVFRDACSVEVHVDASLILPPAIDGTIFLCRPDVLDRSLTQHSDQHASITAQTVVVDAMRDQALGLAARLRLAAAIDNLQYFEWQNARTSISSRCLYGQKTVGASVGAEMVGVVRQEGDYALLCHSGLSGLPALLAAYLHAYVSTL